MEPVEPFDCELIRAGFPAQPVNAASALAFVAVAIWLWRRGRPGVAAFAAAVGIGSVWFHADPSGASSWAHDVSLYALIAVAAVELWRLLVARRAPRVAGMIFLGGAAAWFFSRTGGALCAPGSLLQGHALWHAAAAVAVGLLFAERGAEGDIATP